MKPEQYEFSKLKRANSHTIKFEYSYYQIRKEANRAHFSIFLELNRILVLSFTSMYGEVEYQ